MVGNLRYVTYLVADATATFNKKELKGQITLLNLFMKQHLRACTWSLQQL